MKALMAYWQPAIKSEPLPLRVRARNAEHARDLIRSEMDRTGHWGWLKNWVESGSQVQPVDELAGEENG